MTDLQLTTEEVNTEAFIACPPEGCPVCKQADLELWSTTTDREYKTTSDLFRFHKCHSCGVIFIDPMPVDRLAEIYPGNYYSFEHTSSFVDRIKQRLDRRRFASLLRTLPGEQLSVLDVGGGTGWLLDVIRAVDERVVRTQVVDLDPRAGALARQQGHEYFEGRIEDFQSPARFDLVLMLNLIEHVADPVAVMQRVEQLLSPSGRVLVKTPNTDASDARLFRQADWGGLHCPRHWVLFDEPSFRQMISGTGLVIERLAYTQGAPFWAWSTLFWLEDRGWVRITAGRPAMKHPLFPPLAAGFAALDLARSPLAKTSQMFVTLKQQTG